MEVANITEGGQISRRQDRHKHSDFCAIGTVVMRFDDLLRQSNTGVISLKYLMRNVYKQL